MQPGICLETFLGGMETHHVGCFQRLVQLRLETFLGGMETVLETSVAYLTGETDDPKRP